MCLIIDCNTVHRIFPLPHADFAPLVAALQRGDAKLVCGGELKREYQRMENFWRYFISLDRQGRARLVNDSKVDQETTRQRQRNVCTSDDQHVIALAVVSGARLLCSGDNLLCDDFRNPRIVANPRGNIYRKPRHINLIRKHCHP